MADRSDHAVESQAGPGSPGPRESSRVVRLLIGWSTAFAALGVSTLLLAAGIWLVRLPLAEFIIGAALAERGAEADFRVVALDLDSVALTDLRLGAQDAPDASAVRVEARWRWRGLTPQLTGIRVVEPHLRVRLDRQGHVSTGALERIRGRPTGKRPEAPRFALELVDGEALIEAPFGALIAQFDGAGEIGRDFAAHAAIAPSDRQAGAYALRQGAGALTLTAREDGFEATLEIGAGSLTWDGLILNGAALNAEAQAPLDLSRFILVADWRAREAANPALAASGLTGAMSFETALREDALQPGQWRGGGRMQAAALSFADAALSDTRLETRLSGDGARGRIGWTLGADHLTHALMTSRAVSASGALTLMPGGRTSGEAHVALARAALSAEAERAWAQAIPSLSGAPVGPTLASAEDALLRAGRGFSIAAPLVIDSDETGLRVRVDAPIEARALSGARLRLAPLRRDAPALVMQWPGAALQGAVALELSGGGAPRLNALFDTLYWAPDAPLEADGTLAIADWRAEGASISAEELGLTVTLPAAGGGRVDLAGPLRISGPLGDGAVRDMVAALDIAASWGDGWRVTPRNSCLPIRLGGLDAAGLSFSDGAFSLCARGGALIGADRSGRLAGGFSVRTLALNGRLAGEAAQPAHVRAADIIGAFGGRAGDILVTLEAQTPALAVEMSAERTFDLALRRISAEARIGETWSVTGRFAEGVLTDPALPGAVSAIAGNWSAKPESGRPVIRVDAAEALVVANRPATDLERLLFNPLRLADASAVLREGRIDARGAIMLETPSREIARFTAVHDVSAGAGAAEVKAEQLVFAEGFQPFHITERARGLVDNVRGAASAWANVSWSRDEIKATGAVRLDGVSMATSTIPVVRDVRGEVHFDDLFALTTPPGQSVSVGLVNPGVAVRNGRVRFQLLGEQRLSIEQAEFDYASGVLAIAPTTITLGADETRFSLALRDIEAAELIASLNLPDLQATGRIEGDFPLRLTRRSGYIENGVLRAQPPGGMISYVGAAGADAAGPAQLAFEALRSFRYDNLTLTLNGDLSGEVVSTIEFSGRNAGRPVDLGRIAPAPGLGSVRVRGAPFHFNVRVTAPFRRLAQIAASVTDPGALFEQARENQNGAPPVDQTPAPPE